MVFHRRTEPAQPGPKATAATPQRPVAQHLAAQGMTIQNMGQNMGQNSGSATAGSLAGHNSGMLEESLIGSDLSIEGQAITIRCKGTLRVNGNIQADLHSRQLDVGREAIVTGSITADAVEVHGRVNGAILSNKVVLHATAEVEGDIAAQYLSIEQGASFDGRSRRVRDPAEVNPQTEPVPALANTPQRTAAPRQPQPVGYADHLMNGATAPDTQSYS